MPESELYSISDFAKYSHLSRDTLLHYDRIGLLPPVLRGENNYRYYSGSQIAGVNVIRTLQKLGMTLDEIKELRDRRTPEIAIEVLEHQIAEIDKRIDEWIRARKFLLTIRETINSAMNINEDEISIRYLPTEPIVLGCENDFSGGRTFYDTLESFFNYLASIRPEIDINYYSCALHSEEKIKNREWHRADRYYFYNPEGADTRPAALYAIGYTRGHYGEVKGVFDRLLDYIDKNGFEVCGPAYEEYPLNEVCIADENNYLIRVMITVCEKK